MFKFASFWIEFGTNITIIERQTYSLLEWVGDIGGLFDGLRYFGLVLIIPLKALLLKLEIASLLFRVASIDSNAEECNNIS